MSNGISAAIHYTISFEIILIEHFHGNFSESLCKIIFPRNYISRMLFIITHFHSTDTNTSNYNVKANPNVVFTEQSRSLYLHKWSKYNSNVSFI